jgi:hypothetical protein
MENINNLVIAQSKKMSVTCIRNYYSKVYNYPLSWKDRLRILFVNTIQLEVVPASLVKKVELATSVYFKQVATLGNKDGIIHIAGTDIPVIGCLKFKNFQELVDYYMEHQEDAIRSCVAAYYITPERSILIKYGNMPTILIG